MASWKGKLNFPKPSPNGPSTSAAAAALTVCAVGNSSAEPQPSTSRGTSSMAIGAHGTSQAQTNGHAKKPKPSNITEQPVIREWMQEQKATNPDIVNNLTFEGFTFSERVHTFVENNWPAWANQSTSTIGKRSSGKNKKKRSNSVEPGQELCTPQTLALAGFMLLPEEMQVKCFICHRRKNTDEFASTTDPWEVHEELFPGCPIIKQGKPARPDDFNLGQILFLMGECEALRLEYEYYRLEEKINGMMEHVLKKDEE